MKEFESSMLVSKLGRENKVFSNELESLWNAIKPSIASVSQLFPQYTPHDVTHLQRLFRLGDSILGSTLVEGLNATECFLLAAAIIAHDWGMGVSLAEQEAIVNGHEGLVAIQGPDGQPIWQPLLIDENHVFREHCRTRNVTYAWNKDLGHLADADQEDSWRDYLRDTHPARSAERIRHHFKSHETALGIGLALIAHGHGRNEASIEDTSEYSVGAPLNGSLVNLQALTLYLRFIDLLDIGKGRTPYELWRFVNPGNQRSAAEWKKHQAMDEPVFDEKIIHFSAHPNDGAILAELFNLKRVCEKELDWQTRLLYRLSAPRYHYPRSHTNWTIIPTGNLNSTAVCFEFAREELLHLLSEEIYDGDPYVFLRELLQNAIDATRARQELLAKTTTPLDCKQAAISITADANGDSITVRDSGTGMTAYVIERYLSVVGKSYYQSPDFKRLGLSMDPISRFGIGILACFVVAERVVIRTRTDPACFASNAPTATEAWELEISSGRDGLPLGYWQWRHLDPNSREVGTAVTVFVSRDKLKNQVRHLEPQYRTERLRITEYLKTIAGFVCFPIYVQDCETRTVILHPLIPANEVLSSQQNSFSIHSLSLTYDLTEHVNPLDLEVAKANIAIVSIDIGELGIPGIEGVLSYPKPISPWRVVKRTNQNFQLADGNGNKIEISGPKWSSGGDRGFMESYRREGMCKSAKAFKRSAVFFKGILLPDTESPKDVGGHKRFTSALLNFPKLYLNYSKSRGCDHRTGPSRRNTRDANGEWPNEIFAAHSRRLARLSRDHLLNLAPIDRIAMLLRMLEGDFVCLDDFAEEFGWEELPVPLLLGGGAIEVKLLRDLKSITVIVDAPPIIAKASSAHLLRQLDYPVANPPVLKRWKYPMCAFEIHFENLNGVVRSYTASVLKQVWANQSRALALNSPRLKSGGKFPPFFPNRWEKRPKERASPLRQEEYMQWLNDGTRDCDTLSNSDLRGIGQWVPSSLRFERNAGRYPGEFSSYCLWTDSVVNVEHPVGRALFRAFRNYVLARIQNLLSPVESALFEKLLSGLPISTFSEHDYNQQTPFPNSLRKLNERFVELKHAVEKCPTVGLPYFPQLKLTPTDFLPGAFNFVDDEEFISLSLQGDLLSCRTFFAASIDEDFGNALLVD